MKINIHINEIQGNNFIILVKMGSLCWSNLHFRQAKCAPFAPRMTGFHIFFKNDKRPDQERPSWTRNSIAVTLSLRP